MAPERPLAGGYERLAVRVATIPPSEWVQLPTGLDENVKLYDAWGKPREAKEWRTKLLETHRQQKGQLFKGVLRYLLCSEAQRLIEGKETVVSGCS